ncbi:MAG: TIGR02996 domain-containing protein [Gemmataceae bacterium]
MLEDAFLADIAEHPDDDAPRLIYADWLDDRGRADRAEFIRVQVRRLALPEDAYEQRELAGVEAALLEQHEAAWRAALPALDGVTWGEFSRGFVSQVRVRSEAAFLAHAPALFRAAPVRRLKVVEPVRPDAAGPLAASEYLSRLTELDVGNGAMPDFRSAQTLLASPHLTRLRCLLLHGNDLGDDVFGPLAHAGLSRLEELYLSGSGVTELGVQRLADRDALGTLTVLDLRDDALGGGSVRALARWACAPTLRTLFVVNNRLGPAAAADLAWRLPALERLYLNHNAIGDDGAQALADSPLQQLRELDVRYGDIRDPGLLALAASPLASRLTRVWLAGNPMNARTTPQELRRLLGPRLAG